MSHEISCSWIDDMAFEATVNGHSITIDADEQFGGKDRGPRPKPLMLVALAGCTGMDVISILKKMRVQVSSFNVRVTAPLTQEHPKYYQQFHVIYEFSGTDLPREKLEKAVRLSQDRYCGVSALYKKAVDLTWEIVVTSE